MRRRGHIVGPPSVLASALAGALIACAPEAPDEPTWADDVEPILVANCARCHGAPPFGGAPGTFRLDRYEDQADPPVAGAASQAARIAARVTSILDPIPPPPGTDQPGGPPLTERQREILVLWAELGAPAGEPDE